MKNAMLVALLLLGTSLCGAQRNGGTVALTAVAVVDFQATLSSNGSSTYFVATPSRKQLTNCATDYSGGALQPTDAPVGQLYCTTAAQTSGEGAGGPTQGVVSVTSSGTGIASADNGENAGGTDSPLTLTDTYGGTTDDSVCTGDPHNSDPTITAGLPPAACVSSSSAVFSQSTDVGFGNADSLWPTLYAVNSTTMDASDHYYRDVYFYVGNLTALWDWEMDINYNASDTAYTASHGGYYGWGTHWNASRKMFEYCPQNCTGWKMFKGTDVNGKTAVLTQYPFTNNHWYHIRQYGHRLSVTACTYSSSSNCYFYDYMTINDVTAATAPVTYALTDSTTGGAAGGIPVNHSTWTNGVTPQVQIDMTTANASTSVHVVSDTVTFYHY